MGFALPKAATASRDMTLAVMPGTADGVCWPGPSPKMTYMHAAQIVPGAAELSGQTGT